MAQPPGSTRRAAAGGAGNATVGWSVGIGLAVVVIIVVAVATSRRENPAPPPQEPAVAVRPPPEPPRPPPVDPAEERLRELEAFATPTADPQAILDRCFLARAVFRGSPLEPRFKQIEARAQERLKEMERSAGLDRTLALVRKIIAEDPGCARRAEVERHLEAALKEAGPRSAEVQKLQSDYRTLCEEAAKRRAEDEKKPPPPKKWADFFAQATKRIQANDYPGAKTLYLEGLPTLPEKRPEDVAQRALYCIGLYNLACIYSVEAVKLTDKARSEAVDHAFKYLDWALRSDYGRFRCPCHPQTAGLGHMADDKDMDPIRKDARYAELVKKYK